MSLSPCRKELLTEGVCCNIYGIHTFMLFHIGLQIKEKTI